MCGINSVKVKVSSCCPCSRFQGFFSSESGASCHVEERCAHYLMLFSLFAHYLTFLSLSCLKTSFVSVFLRPDRCFHSELTFHTSASSSDKNIQSNMLSCLPIFLFNLNLFEGLYVLVSVFNANESICQRICHLLSSWRSRI